MGIRAPDAEASTAVQSAVEATEPGKVMGTPNYMAPEQARAEPAEATETGALPCLDCMVLARQSA